MNAYTCVIYGVSPFNDAFLLYVATIGLASYGLLDGLMRLDISAVAPAVVSWCRRTGQSPSRYLLPISFATILGGTLTLVGTSTNLVVSGLPADAGAAIDLDEVREQIRRLSHELRPLILDQLGLVPALNFLANGFTKRSRRSIVPRNKAASTSHSPNIASLRSSKRRSIGSPPQRIPLLPKVV